MLLAVCWFLWKYILDFVINITRFSWWEPLGHAVGMLEHLVNLPLDELIIICWWYTHWFRTLVSLLNIIYWQIWIYFILFLKNYLGVWLESNSVAVFVLKLHLATQLVDLVNLLRLLILHLILVPHIILINLKVYLLQICLSTAI